MLAATTTRWPAARPVTRIFTGMSVSAHDGVTRNEVLVPHCPGRKTSEQDEERDSQASHLLDLVELGLGDVHTRRPGDNVCGSETGITLLFDRNNWFTPRTIRIVALDDEPRRGHRVINIQHSVVQGASPARRRRVRRPGAPGRRRDRVDDDAADTAR